MNQFQKDLAAARPSEQLVFDVLKKKTQELPATMSEAWITFINVSEIPYYYYKGDIKAVDKLDNEIMIEVKNDGRIADTHNVLCEEKNYFYDKGEWKLGNMHNDYEIYCVVSERERKIYVLDFKTMKRLYKTGRYKEIPHDDNISCCYLLPLSRLQKEGGILYVLNY